MSANGPEGFRIIDEEPTLGVGFDLTAARKAQHRAMLQAQGKALTESKLRVSATFPEDDVRSDPHHEEDMQRDMDIVRFHTILGEALIRAVAETNLCYTDMINEADRATHQLATIVPTDRMY